MTVLAVQPVAKVLEPGPFTTVQDSGRHGYRRFGVPASGALDLLSLSAANGQLGNKPDSPALELFQGPVVIEALADLVVGHSDGSSLVSVDGGATQANPLRIKGGSVLRLEAGAGSAILYLAFPGGIVVDSVMGSASTYTRASFGGVRGRIIQKGDILYAQRDVERNVSRREMHLELPRHHRVVRGPHAELFPPESLRSFFEAEYHVSFQSDRMGYRLEGPALKGFHEWGRVLTFPVFPGMVQVTPDGLPIVLMADCQTTGGYPVIALVLPSDLCALARKPPSSPVAFKEVTEEEARAAMVSFTESIGFGPDVKH